MKQTGRGLGGNASQASGVLFFFFFLLLTFSFFYCNSYSDYNTMQRHKLNPKKSSSSTRRRVYATGYVLVPLARCSGWACSSLEKVERGTCFLHSSVHLRTRSITLIIACNVFKSHGTTALIDGRWVVDDYGQGASQNHRKGP
ncbi:hypothetical protein BJV78DRAFT_929606 [Lactifluus subvellereus]|nr:hypothetical protein BJV78DRAFT_929606 [Lactifluus subvellereus]